MSSIDNELAVLDPVENCVGISDVGIDDPITAGDDSSFETVDPDVEGLMDDVTVKDDEDAVDDGIVLLDKVLGKFELTSG